MTLCLGVDGEWSVVLVSDRAMRRFNRDFSGNDYATDVLSFPNQPESWEDPKGKPYLGDILISVETANTQRRGSLLDELKLLALHGLLHLLGYDHETDHGEMTSLEDSLRRELGLR